ncbi:MAG TPA: alpha/beta hydrolase [Candidatus Limnocylindrales bacterium]|nr:alpha/beta hydrolase [Candidatus Limnocylindrales bacterium]
MPTTTEPTTRTLDVPGATLVYDVRPNAASSEPPLFLIGAPMGAAGFPTLAGHFADRTIITYDPRGTERSTTHDPSAAITPETAAEDLHAIVEAIGGPVDVFASSGGAVNGLAWAARHPGDVRILVAHEPPLVSPLPDREHALAATRAMHETYMRSGFGPAMAQFIVLVSHKGPITAEIAAAPPPDPAMFGMPTEDDGNRTDLMFAHQMRWLVSYEPDYQALRRASTRIVIAAGAESDGTLASRGAYAVAERLGTEVVVFPGDHGAFMGGEYGQQPGEHEAFAAKLREVLSR